MPLKKTVCACERCQAACRNTPGWFRPGEAEKAAKYLGLTLPVFFKSFLGVNWWVDADRDVFVLAPAMDRMDPGEEYPGNPKGQCVFFKDGHCSIHAVKPYHCSHGNPCELNEPAQLDATARTVTLWRKEQDQIVALLGRKPESAVLSPLEWMFM